MSAGFELTSLSSIVLAAELVFETGSGINWFVCFAELTGPGGIVETAGGIGGEFLPQETITSAAAHVAVEKAMNRHSRIREEPSALTGQYSDMAIT
ncbi:MAG: hypothetical protein EXS24_07070 [Pedosphaera sp.]|nr:hypothetical protein [Pedosphaera sp.]